MATLPEVRPLAVSGCKRRSRSPELGIEKALPAMRKRLRTINDGSPSLVSATDPVLLADNIRIPSTEQSAVISFPALSPSSPVHSIKDTWRRGQCARDMRALRRTMRQESVCPTVDPTLPPPLFDSPRVPCPSWHSPPTLEDVASLEARIKFGLSLDWYLRSGII